MTESDQAVLIAVGSLIALAGFLLLSKVLDKVYLDPRFNVDVAVLGFFLAGAIIWAGMWLAAYGFGVFS